MAKKKTTNANPLKAKAVAVGKAEPQKSGRHTFNKTYYPQITHHKNSGISETIQNDAYTIRELLQKHAAGMNSEIYREGTYEDEPNIDFPNPINNPDFDLVDAKQHLEDIDYQLTEEREQREAELIKQKAASEAEATKGSNEVDDPKSEGGATTQSASGTDARASVASKTQ